MDTLERLKALYGDYIDDMEKCLSEDGSISGTLSTIFSGGKRTSQCSRDFIAAAEAIFAGPDDPGELPAIADFIMDMAVAYKSDRAVGLMFTAMLSFLTPRLSGLSGAEAESLRRRFEGAFPRADRTPAMKEFLRQLNRV